MKKLTVGAIASACAVAALVWSMPAAAVVNQVHDKNFYEHERNDDSSSTSVPEPGTMALLAMGLGGLALRRRRKD